MLYKERSTGGAKAEQSVGKQSGGWNYGCCQRDFSTKERTIFKENSRLLPGQRKRLRAIGLFVHSRTIL